MEQYTAAMDPARVPPNHPEAEKGVLGSMLRSRDAALIALESLQAEDFYNPANREIFSAMQAISAGGRPIDLVTLDDELSRRGRLDAVGGAPYLVEISRAVPSSANIRAYVKIVDERSTLRKLIYAAEKIERDCYQGEE